MCSHSWFIGEAKGLEATGKCRLCGAVKTFRTAPEKVNDRRVYKTDKAQIKAQNNAKRDNFVSTFVRTQEYMRREI